MRTLWALIIRLQLLIAIAVLLLDGLIIGYFYQSVVLILIALT